MNRGEPAWLPSACLGMLAGLLGLPPPLPLGAERVKNMINYDLPFGFCRMDTVAGTVVRACHAGVEVALDMDDLDAGGTAKAFVRCGGKVGQRVLVSLQYFNKKRENFFALLDCYLNDGPVKEIEAAMKTEEQAAAALAA